MNEVCVIGGAALFALALPKAGRIYLTEVDARVRRATCSFRPSTRPAGSRSAAKRVPAGADDEYAFVFRALERR